MDNAVYIVFSATPTGMGRLIRRATRNRYNHVSLSLSRDIRSEERRVGKECRL